MLAGESGVALTLDSLNAPLEVDIPDGTAIAELPRSNAGNPAPSPVLKAPITSADMETVLARFNQLSQAIKDMDSDAMREITVASKRKNAYFDYVFGSFNRLDARVGNIRVSRQDQTIRATLYIGRMFRSNGDMTIPPQEFSTIPIYSIKKSQWSDIHW